MKDPNQRDIPLIIQYAGNPANMAESYPQQVCDGMDRNTGFKAPSTGENSLS